MAGEWIETTLGEVTDSLSGGTPSKARPEYWNGAVPWVSAKDMKKFRLEDTEDHLSNDGVLNGTKLAPAGSVLLLVRGMTLLKDLPICKISRPMTFNQDVKALLPKPHVRGDYLPYLLLGIKDRLLTLVDLAGHGTGRLNSDELKALDIVLPPLPEQRAIAHILGTLDDKIELNRRMSETLEAMARALFKSWFVDFAPVRAKADGRDPGLPRPLADHFPARLVDSELGEIPSGWEIGNLGDAVTLVRDQENPQSSPEVEFHHFSIPAFDEGQWPKSELGKDILSQKTRVPPGAVLLSKLNPEIERVWLVDVAEGDQALCSTEFLVLLPKSLIGRSFVYCLCRSPILRRAIEGLVTGTSKSHQRVSAQTVLSIKTVLPSSCLAEAFERHSAPLLFRTLAARREAHTLAALRDALLPKLISGELRVKDAEKFIRNAVG